MTTRAVEAVEGAAASRLRRLAEDVADPELVLVTLGDLGVIRDAVVTDGAARVVICPTYSGCPAMATIIRSIVDAARAAGFERCDVDVELAPPWTTDAITERGRNRLRALGIAPPEPVHDDGPTPVRLTAKPPCPRCHSRSTRPLSPHRDFGSTLCKTNYRCVDCSEMFEYFKAH